MNKYTRKLIVVGENGNGKSLTCNTLLGREVFDGSKRSRTAACETCYLHVRSTKLWLVDSPGMFDTDSVLAERALEIQKAVTEECENPHAFLVVFKADSQAEERYTNTVEMLRIIFGENCLKHVIVVITNGAKFRSDAEFETYWKQGKMKEIVDQCQGRVARLENKDATPQRKKEMTDKVLALVDKVSRMGRSAYRNRDLPSHTEMLEDHLLHVDADIPISKQIDKMKKSLKGKLPVNGDSAFLAVT